MSITIGNLINETLNDNRLKINTYDNSNVINLNSDGISYKDAIINYKNLGEIGVSNSAIVFNYDNKNLFNANLRRSFFNNDVFIKNNFYTTETTTYLNSNVFIKLTNNPANNFKIVDNSNNSIFQTTNSNVTFNFNNNNKLTFDNTQLKANDNFTIHSNYSLIVSNIKSINPAFPIIIDNANFKNLIISTYNVKNSITIDNDTLYPNPTISINRYLIDCNILDIYNKKIIDNSSNRIFSINKNGFVGIGSNTALYPIDININSVNNPLIFNYNNDANSNNSTNDKFIINNRGYIGIGTNITPSHLNIIVNDDKRNITNNPVINLNFNYNRNSNFRTSNIIDLNFIAEKRLTPIYNNEDTQTGIIETNFDNFNYLITNNSNIFDATDTTNTTVQITVLNTVNNDYITANQISSIVNYSSYSYDPLIINENGVDYLINYTIKYPSFLNVNSSVSSPIINLGDAGSSRRDITFTSFLLKEGSVLQSIPSQSFIDNLYLKVVSKRIYIFNPANDNSFRIFVTHRLYIERNTYQLKSFIDSLTYIYQPPSLLLYASSNNNFAASLNSEGKLSLGDIDNSDSYYLFVNKKTRLNNLECDYLSSVTGKNNINFSYCNISNINKAFINSNISVNLISEQTNFKNSIISNLSSSFINSFEINTSNLNYNKIEGANLLLTSNLFNPTLKIILGKITSNDDYFMNVNAFSNLNGISVKSDNSNLNPFISINGLVNKTYPYMILSNTTASYSINILNNNKNYLLNDNFSFVDNKNNKIVLKHINYNDNQNNQLIIGSNQVIFDLKDSSEPNNETNKIALGFPYRFLLQNNLTINNWENYFKDNYLNSDCMLNVYGNINFSTINNTPFLKCVATDFPNETVSVNIAGAPSRTGFVFNVKGNSYFSCNIDVNNDINLKGTVGNVSDIRLKTNILKISEPLYRINRINGYIYKRKDTGRIETGLIAQEVMKILPEVITNNRMDEYYNISYGNMMGLMVEGIKELDYKIKELQSKFIFFSFFMMSLTVINAYYYYQK